MPQVSPLHLGFVSTCSRGLFPLPSLSYSESSPMRLLGLVLIHHGPSSCWINHHPDAGRDSQRNLSHSSFYSPHCLLLALPVSFLLFLPQTHTHTHLYTHLVKKCIPSSPCPPACLVCLSGSCLTLPRQHTNTLKISIYTQWSW